MDCCGFKGQLDALFLKSELQSGCRRLFDCFIIHPAKLRRKRTGTICFLTVCCDGCSCRSLLWCLLLQTWSIDGRLAQPGNVQPACLNHRHRRKCSCVRDNGKNWSLATLAGFCTTVFQVTKGNWSQLGDTGINDFWDQLVSFSGFLVRHKCLISVYSTPRFKCI